MAGSDALIPLEPHRKRRVERAVERTIHERQRSGEWADEWAAASAVLRTMGEVLDQATLIVHETHSPFASRGAESAARNLWLTLMEAGLTPTGATAGDNPFAELNDYLDAAAQDYRPPA